MICVRCGYCCVHLTVIIIAPEYATPNFRMSRVVKEQTFCKHSGEECPHLSFETDKAICAIHRFKWYEQTPCFSHTQIGAGDAKCRMGVFVKEKNISIAGGG